MVISHQNERSRFLNPCSILSMKDQTLKFYDLGIALKQFEMKICKKVVFGSIWKKVIFGSFDFRGVFWELQKIRAFSGEGFFWENGS